MIPFGSETVTLVQRIEDTVNGKKHITYRTAKLSGCSWRRTLRHNREGEVLATYEGVTCRVPAGQTAPHAGDLLILGDVAVTVTGGADYQQLIERYRGQDGAFVVASVSDNARPGMPLLVQSLQAFADSGALGVSGEQGG